MPYLNPYIELCLEGTSSLFKGLNQKDKETIAQHHTLTFIKRANSCLKKVKSPADLSVLLQEK